VTKVNKGRNCMVGIHNTKGIKLEVYESVHQNAHHKGMFCEESMNHKPLLR
jgi:hypothetical protein